MEMLSFSVQRVALFSAQLKYFFFEQHMTQKVKFYSKKCGFKGY